jgi:uncharacterized protein YceK
MMTRAFTILAVFALLLSGCGTIIHGSKQDLAIKTVPAGAVAVVGDQQCTTPCTLKDVPRAEKYAYFKKGGVKKEFKLEKDLNFVSTFVGNILCLEFGVVWDVVFGGAFDIRPVNVSLNDLDAASER